MEHKSEMIEEKFGDFFRSPAGILLIIAIIGFVMLLVIVLVFRVFEGLLDPRQFVWE